jgi:hypothetical protein
VSRIVEAVKQRRNARRWQRWSENDPLDDLAHRSRFALGVALCLFVLLVVALVFALVPR